MRTRAFPRRGAPAARGVGGARLRVFRGDFSAGCMIGTGSGCPGGKLRVKRSFRKRRSSTLFFHVLPRRLLSTYFASVTVPIPPDRVRASKEVAAVLGPGRRVALTTHVNADGDGVGSEVALWHLLTARRVQVAIANPTPIPSRFDFLIPPGSDRSDRAAKEIEAADVIVVVDISDLSRLGDLAPGVRKARGPTACIDHHVSPGSLPAGPRLVAPDASASAELVFDFATALGWELGPDAARALYVGILTDTGAFRFANTTPRVLQVASALLSRGVDPESIYEAVYASAPEGRVRLTAEVLQTLVVEPDVGLAWVTVPHDALARHHATADDLDGIVEYPRTVAGVRLALLFRQIANGRVKVSFRSLGEVDVAELALRFGGGGHKKAAGASLEGSIAEAQEAVLAAARAYLGQNPSSSPTRTVRLGP